MNVCGCKYRGSYAPCSGIQRLCLTITNQTEGLQGTLRVDRGARGTNAAFNSVLGMKEWKNLPLRGPQIKSSSGRGFRFLEKESRIHIPPARIN